MGEFQFLGELYFRRTDENPVMEIEILTKEKAPDTLRVLVFNNANSSFDLISRGDSGDSCSGNELVSKSFTQCKPGHHCSHGLRVKDFGHSYFGPQSDFCGSCNEYSQKVEVEYHKGALEAYQAWYFVAANCGGGPVKIKKYIINSAAADPLRPDPTTTSSLDDDYILGYAFGNFDLLGSLCFFPGPKIFGGTLLTMTVTYDNETPDHDKDVYLLAYDDDSLHTLFDSKSSSYDFSEKECRRRLDHAAHAVKLGAGTNRDTFSVSSSDISYGVEHDATRLSFVVMQCAPASQLKVNNIKIHSAEAVDCARKCPLFADCGDDAVVVHGRRLRGSED